MNEAQEEGARPMKHHCHAIGCETVTKPTNLLCAEHWAVVPVDIRILVIRHYRKGQCVDKKPSLEWRIAATRARLAVALHQNHDGRIRLLERVLDLYEKKAARAA